jgi:hypothetical protein
VFAGKAVGELKPPKLHSNDEDRLFVQVWNWKEQAIAQAAASFSLPFQIRLSRIQLLNSRVITACFVHEYLHLCLSSAVT